MRAELAMAREGQQAGPQGRLHLSDRAVRTLDPGRDLPRQVRREGVDQRQKQRFLVREVMVDGALGGAGGAHDVVHRRPVIPFLGEHRERRLENPVPRRQLAHGESACP